MRSYTRIAAIVLGAFALGILVVAGWTALVSEAVDLSDRVRRARCDWVEPLVVSIAGHELSVAATPLTTINTGQGWISGEEVSGYRVSPDRYGFCFDHAPDSPVQARSVTLAIDAAATLAAAAGLPEVDGPLIEIGEPALFLPDAPDAVGQSSEMTVYYRNEDYGWPRMVTRGTTGDGFRIGAVCRDADSELDSGRWLCDVSVLDRRQGLSYRFEHLPVEAVAFDAEPVPAPFVEIARALRDLGRMLEKDAVAQR